MSAKRNMAVVVMWNDETHGTWDEILPGGNDKLTAAEAEEVAREAHWLGGQAAVMTFRQAHRLARPIPQD